MTVSVSSLTDDIFRLAEGASRFVIAIAGPPGAGKSTISEALRETLIARGETAEILPMDGFHMDNGILEQRGLLKRKGAPETFDVRGFLDIVTAVKAGGEEVLVPVFDRDRELAIASARPIAPETRFILVEGNYLLLDRAPWTRLQRCFDLTVFVGPPLEVLEQRLRDRWVHYGLDEAAITWKLNGNDLPNGRLVIEASRPADISVDIVAIA
ncbi:nucleoside triphosphate hydrolase [Agrobacterium vitis]|uniref:nucleoside triphosphate hydrolase n=1 Tax=Agrobacterium vitis TaxID=373 RepID=UPI000871ED32|nr:nucleoside triphosphate hydrolase [Agrobacterium vitis]MCE6077817.1 nucleoside/nucleotide kinase family protein [Agrobacterium vitis]MCM2471400.1 nucleoside triphosphate hydrolase [Agrobacterium vitis]MUO72417.1 nucleoside/nucleotide kinase family protein [Agrobacterium vitis]MUO86402.1 nucleoside/nucleotide kinase family protein [Agrobacterium vitis]